MPSGSREDNPGHAAEVPVRGDRGRERGRKGVVGQRIEAVLPPRAGDPERPSAALDSRLDPANEAVAVQDRQDVVAPAPLRGRDVDLPHVVEVEEASEEVPVPAERVERREEGHARVAVGGRHPGLDLALRLLEQRALGSDDEPLSPQSFDGRRDQLAAVDELGSKLPPLARGPRSGLARRPRGHSQPQLRLAAVPSIPPPR